jgi:hypothetical protein
MKLRHILSPCFVFGHEAHPVSAVRKGVLVFECRRCHQVIRTPLKQQKPKYRQVATVIRPQFGKQRAG